MACWQGWAVCCTWPAADSNQLGLIIGRVAVARTDELVIRHFCSCYVRYVKASFPTMGSSTVKSHKLGRHTKGYNESGCYEERSAAWNR